MNLIEQLGGYEAAKKKANDKGIGFLLSKELLEYRRQHNIFEAGNKVVEITDYPSNDVLTVKSISDKLLVCESDDFNASYVLSNKYKPYFYVRRATGEEIEAGKRLEVV
ncbi:hypothetical protein ACLIL3_016765 [Acinetobacter radioresistens]|uniref:hypothetical protein n=1 Tax=Acinetobacter radioresistens TaxID=40216 RepID=UPI003984688A